MTCLRGTASSLRLCDLNWKCIEVDEQEFAELMHLVGDFLSRLIFTVNSLVSIKAKFVCPRLELRCDSMFSSHLVNALLDFPSCYIRGKSLECQFHRFPVHPGGGIVVTSGTASGGLPKRLRHAVRNTARRLVNIGWWVHRSQGEIIRSKDIPFDLRKVETMSTAIGCLVDDKTNRLKASIAPRRNRSFAHTTSDIEIRTNLKCDPCAFAVGAVMHQRCHVDLLVCKSGIVA